MKVHFRWVCVVTGRRPQQQNGVWSRTISGKGKSPCLTSVLNLCRILRWNKWVWITLRKNNVRSLFLALMYRFKQLDMKNTYLLYCLEQTNKKYIYIVKETFVLNSYLGKFFDEIFRRHFVVRGPEKTPHEGRCEYFNWSFTCASIGLLFTLIYFIHCVLQCVSKVAIFMASWYFLKNFLSSHPVFI